MDDNTFYSDLERYLKERNIATDLFVYENYLGPDRWRPPKMIIKKSKFNENQYLIYYGKYTRSKKYDENGPPGKTYWTTEKSNLNRVVAGLFKRSIHDEMRRRKRKKEIDPF